MNRFTPKIVIILIAVIILGIIGASYMIIKNNKNNQAAMTSTDPSTLAADAEYSNTGNGEQIENFDFLEEGTNSASPLPSPAPIADFIYPSSTVKNQTITHLELESSSGSDTITKWYETKIRDLKFNAKSFAKSTANGNVLNKLSGAKPEETIEVTIKQDQNTSKVLITVDRS